MVGPMSALPAHQPTVGALIYDEHGRPTWRYRVEPFREAVRASGATLSEIAIRCGFEDDSHVSRLLGFRSWQSGRRGKDGQRYVYRASTVSYENAAKLAQALHLDLTEWEI